MKYLIVLEDGTILKTDREDVMESYKGSDMDIIINLEDATVRYEIRDTFEPIEEAKLIEETGPNE